MIGKRNDNIYFERVRWSKSRQEPDVLKFSMNSTTANNAAATTSPGNKSLIDSLHPRPVSSVDLAEMKDTGVRMTKN